MLRERVLRFNWRLALGHILMNALSLALVIILLPGIRLVHPNPVLSFLAAGLIFGVLNAFVRPVLQFVMFNFLFATFGLVLVLINFILLLMLDWLTGGWFQADGLIWTLLAAVLVGLFGVLFESLLGMSPPVIDTDTPVEENDMEVAVAEGLTRLIHPIHEDQPEAEQEGEQ